MYASLCLTHRSACGSKSRPSLPGGGPHGPQCLFFLFSLSCFPPLSFSLEPSSCLPYASSCGGAPHQASSRHNRASYHELTNTRLLRRQPFSGSRRQAISRVDGCRSGTPLGRNAAFLIQAWPNR
ncbi:hypothetical protein BV20DRAFT_432374 [Pilatotrama ljubarskyi]|nr:hypothetical protein BV20DRAFT_432374 [Pilatotrama ljubarskyi]